MPLSIGASTAFLRASEFSFLDVHLPSEPTVPHLTFLPERDRLDAPLSLLLWPTLVVIVFLWLPFGWHMGPLIEEWGVLGLYAGHGVFYFAGADSLMAPHQMRPIMTTLWGIAYRLDPDSWWVWHIELAMTLLIKGASMTWLSLYLTGSSRWAIVGGLLFVLWPADVMQMAFRAMPITFAVAMTTAAAALFIAAHWTSSTVRRWALSLLGAVCIVMGTWTYELTLLLAPVPFLLMVMREGAAGAWTRMRLAWQAGAVWMLSVGACIVYIAWVLLTANVLYQKAIAPPDAQHLLLMLAERIPMLFSYGVVRSLATGWLDAMRIAVRDLGSHWYLILLAVVFACLLWTAGRRHAPPVKRLIGMTMAGLLCLLIAYAPYVVSHLNTSERVFMFAALGSTLIFLALLVWLDRFSSIAAMAAAILLLTLGTAQQLWQFREYDALSGRQREIMKAMVEQAPSMSAGQIMVVLDESQQLGDVWTLDGLIPSALMYLYGKPMPGLNAFVCFPQTGIWPVRDAVLQQGSCAETADAWVFRAAARVTQPGPAAPTAPDVVIPKTQAVVVRIGPDGKGLVTPQVEANRASLTAGDSTVSRRYRHALAENSWPAMLRILDAPPSKSYRWDFGRRWSMQQVMHGSGWSLPGWIYSPWRPRSVVWMNKANAMLLFDLAPANEPYRFSALVTVAAEETSRRSLMVRANGVEVPVVWRTPSDVTAEIPSGVLRSGSNVLALQTAPSNANFGQSLQFDWITIAPTN